MHSDFSLNTVYDLLTVRYEGDRVRDPNYCKVGHDKGVLSQLMFSQKRVKYGELLQTAPEAFRGYCTVVYNTAVVHVFNEKSERA